ncbi:MAG: hypothetical protein CVT49_03435 [candidate division Zixibacteria bacterium HGW-Zixibacteria-1]|nr:MAG: hypothetical protein CVT49_03435 [candidate division Zixibacteria bacterium HGW-Zixibacteria-1]
MSNKEQNNHLKIGELPTLKVIPVNKAIFHEEPDAGRLLNLVNRLGTEGILKNPPIVAKMKGMQKYVILDGANRVTALLKHNFKHVLVQIVDFDDPLLSLQCWHHAIEKLDKEYFLKNISRMPGIEITISEKDISGNELNEEGLREDGFICRMVFSDGWSAVAHNGGDILEQVKQLRKIADLYIQTSYYDRVSYINLDHLRKHYPEFRTLISFPNYAKTDFARVVDSGMKLPAGVTRVFLPKRALGLNVPLEFLKSGLTLDEKNRWLDDMILKKVRDKSIRFYREPTFAFDE